MAWDPGLAADAVAREWVQQTFTTAPWVVDCMSPLGLHHLMGTGHHHGPAPWVDNLERADWNPVYCHRAAREGIGFDRGPRGSNAVAQYPPEWAARLARPETTPEPWLL